MRKLFTVYVGSIRGGGGAKRGEDNMGGGARGMIKGKEWRDGLPSDELDLTRGNEKRLCR